jgi:hypothetical protein
MENQNKLLLMLECTPILLPPNFNQLRHTHTRSNGDDLDLFLKRLAFTLLSFFLGGGGKRASSLAYSILFCLPVGLY